MKKHLFIAISFIVISLALVLTYSRTEKTITFFPIDYDTHFKHMKTSLAENESNMTVDWTSYSETKDPLYLRQDVAILFENGKLNGIQSKWIQHDTTITQHKQFEMIQDGFLYALSFHHGEIHKNEQSIFSIQAMTNDHLYVMEDKFFKTARSSKERHFVEQIKRQTNQQLLQYWNSLIQYFKINKNDFILIPFVNIINFDEYLSSSFNQEQKDRIIGQLWEGLYKNYILQSIEAKANDDMPLLLLANDYSHIVVLYSVNDEKKQLIQRIKVNH